MLDVGWQQAVCPRTLPTPETQCPPWSDGLPRSCPAWQRSAGGSLGPASCPLAASSPTLHFSDIPERAGTTSLCRWHRHGGQAGGTAPVHLSWALDGGLWPARACSDWAAEGHAETQSLPQERGLAQARSPAWMGPVGPVFTP